MIYFIGVLVMLPYGFACYRLGALWGISHERRAEAQRQAAIVAKRTTTRRQRATQKQAQSDHLALGLEPLSVATVPQEPRPFAERVREVAGNKAKEPDAVPDPSVAPMYHEVGPRVDS